MQDKKVKDAKQTGGFTKHRRWGDIKWDQVINIFKFEIVFLPKD